MPKRFLGKILIAVSFCAFFFGGFFAVANAQAVADDVLTRRAKLEADLAVIDKEINDQRVVLEQKQKEGVSLERDVAILNAQIEKAKLSIRARNLSIAGLVDDIGVKNRTIVKYSAKIDREHESLVGLMRRTNELDSYSLVEVSLSNRGFSDFFVDLDNFQYVEDSIGDSLDEVGAAKTATEEERKILEDKKSEETDLRRIQELEKRRLESNEAEKKSILKATKGQEAAYQKILKEKQKSATAIRAELFSLQGSTAISFEKALGLARHASEKTGVRPALILGIIAEESNLGENVGKGTWTVDMHPTRDVPIFKQITAELGLDPDKMPVSKKVWYGYGGAMGPAQFIPSTWILFRDRLVSLTGHNPPNPWDPGDAFMASAMLLKDNGAGTQTYTAEHRAAMCYLAGCANAKKKKLQFYGDDVLYLANKYQGQINILEGR